MTKIMQDYAADDIMLSAEIEKARTTLRALEKERKALFIEAAGVKPGDIVVYKGVEAIVRDVDVGIMYRVDAKPWLGVSVRNKGGEWSQRVQRTFRDWELVE